MGRRYVEVKVEKQTTFLECVENPLGDDVWLWARIRDPGPRGSKMWECGEEVIGIRKE